jgi:hypothetical protein
MKTGYPAVSSGGGWAIEAHPLEREARLALQEPMMGVTPIPLNWPVHRVPTPEEQARIRAAMERRERLMEPAQ